MIWVVFAGLTGVALASVLLPLWRARAVDLHSGNLDSDVTFYQGQIVGIARDEASGLIASNDAESARVEAGRRLLAAERQMDSSSTERTKFWPVSIALILIVPLLSAALYLRLGKPLLPDAPLSARLVAEPQDMDLASAVARIENHLSRNPDDGRGYEVIAPVYLTTGRVDDAVRAFAAALRLNGDTPERRANYAEALVFAAQGIVTAEARTNFDQAMLADPAEQKARYYLGLAAEQDGDRARARELWTKLRSDVPPQSQFGVAIVQGLERLNAAPQRADIAALPDAARDDAVRDMVERLATRLREKGNDIDGWLRLMRAYTVLKDREKAHSALKDARRALQTDKDATVRLDAFARELGIEG